MTATHGVGIDIGGTGIKAAVVDLASGDLVSERVKVDTPEGGKPADVLAATGSVMSQLAEQANGLVFGELPVGVCFPAVVKNGCTMTAANVSDEWIGLAAEELFERELGRSITFVNDADAAGLAEAAFGAARGVSGLTIMTTLGTGIGTALIYDGVLIPNSELGHIEIDGKDAEHRAANSARERKGLTWQQWAKHLQTYYSRLEAYLSPDLFVVGGGVSKEYEEFLPLLRLATPIVPAAFRNNAGILGAASLAAHVNG